MLQPVFLKQCRFGKISFAGSLLFLMMTGLFSCVGKPGKESAPIAGPPSCMKMTSKDIQANWVDKGFTKPGSADLIYYVQVYTGYMGPGSDFKVTVQGLRKDYTAVAGSEFELSADSACLVAFPADVAIGSNSTELSVLNILEADGKLKTAFKKVTLTPQKDPKNTQFLNYTIDVYSTGGPGAPGLVTLPCPPCYYCRPPCDTTITGDTTLNRKADPVMIN